MPPCRQASLLLAANRFRSAIRLGLLTLALAASEAPAAGSMAALPDARHLLSTANAWTQELPATLALRTFNSLHLFPQAPHPRPQLYPSQTRPPQHAYHILRNKSQAQLLKGKGRRQVTNDYKESFVV